MSTSPTQIGPYRIVRPIGQGGMGVVYEAIQEPIERRVAIKVLLPQHAQDHDTLNRFFNEARAVNLIEHPSIVQVSDYGQAPDGTAYLVMEYLRGETLGGRLDRLNTAAQRIPWVEAAQLAAQIADALTAAHDKSIVHRDLKPGNVMLVRDPAVSGGERAKILDFGIAKLTQGQGKGTATNALIGTAQYMSPEQCRGAGGVDGKTDVYALGIMLYEMLAGRPPFLGDNTVEYMGQHVFKEPPSLYDFAPRAHPPLVTLIQRLLIKDKAQRPAMREVGSELSRLVSSVSGARPALTSAAAADSEETRVPVGRRPLPLSTLSGSLGQTLNPVPRMRLRIVGAAVAVTMIASLVTFLAWPGGRQPETPTAANQRAAQTAAPSAPASTPSAPPAPPPAGSLTKAVVMPTATMPLPVKPDPATPKPPTHLKTPRRSAQTGDSTESRPATASPLTPRSAVKPSGKPPAPTTPSGKRPIRRED